MLASIVKHNKARMYVNFARANMAELREWLEARGLGRYADALLECLTHHCHVVETGNDSWRFKSRDDDHSTRAHLVSAILASSDETSYHQTPPLKGVKIGSR